MMKYKDGVVKGLTGGINTLFKANKVSHISGKGSFIDKNTLSVQTSNNETKNVSAKNIIIATGSEITQFPGIEIDEKTILSSTGALELDNVPKNMIIIGAGVIGLELGSVWSKLGSNVTIIEFMNTIGGVGIDTEVSYFTFILKCII